MARRSRRGELRYLTVGPDYGATATAVRLIEDFCIVTARVHELMASMGARDEGRQRIQLTTAEWLQRGCRRYRRPDGHRRSQAVRGQEHLPAGSPSEWLHLSQAEADLPAARDRQDRRPEWIFSDASTRVSAHASIHEWWRRQGPARVCASDCRHPSPADLHACVAPLSRGLGRLAGATRQCARSLR
jgi:hypothetical protein